MAAAAVSYWICSARVETASRMISADERPPMFVLQVGIGKYVNAPVWAELRGAVTDVLEMRKVLESERWGVPPANIVTLTDAEGTKTRIFAEFRSHLIENAKKHYDRVKDPRRGAVVMFQFSGHGSQVPDVNNDEKDDGKDETLVTHDSQDVKGKNFDITDDEIFALTDELRQWTHNVVYVLDSCHSGSGTRNAEDVRRLPERKTVPEPVAGVGTTTRSGTKKEEDGDSGVLPADADYIVITAARPDELASQKNCFEECGATTRPVVFGNLTFYLIEELKNARADTSYRELMENVRRRVTAEKPTQTPQLEGDGSRFVFSGLGRKEDNFVRILEGEVKKAGPRTIRIGAGAMQGVTVGTIVSIYDRSATRFEQVDPIAAGSVIRVTPLESTVTLLRARRQIAFDDKAVVVAADLGTARLRLDLDADKTKLSRSQKNVIESLRSRFDRSILPGQGRGVDLVAPGSRAAGKWDVALLKDKFSTVSPRMGGLAACELPAKDGRRATGEVTAPDTEVFYFAGKDFIPSFRFCIEANFPDESAEGFAIVRLMDAVTHHLAHKTLESISNRRSRLNGKITVTPVRIPGGYRCENGVFLSEVKEPAVPEAKSGRYSFHASEALWLEVTNNSPHDLFVVLFNMAPNGRIKILAPRGDRYEEKDGILIPANGGRKILPGNDCRSLPDGGFTDVGAIRASRLPGLDKFKFIFSVDRIIRDQFLHLEVVELTRDANSSLAGSNDWTTVETILDVSSTKE